MEVNGEEERRSRREDEEKEDYYSLLNSPCSICHKVVQAILKCLGLDSSPIPPHSSSSSSSSPSLVEEEDTGTDELVEETGFMARITGVLRRRPRPPYSSGRPGQNN
ncbi:PREDICTED: elicitor peptide 6-like [Camelina sativa]|uniref:Elicitor peptide 6-like n=1 Tax=Camelina sativa TaxID=90675 RepID=A0ABM0TNZ2_CAMSA|nr:PREDICTED: elicitor peptide 6-like [Camelina sativa]